MEREIDELLLEIARLRRAIEAAGPRPETRADASAEEIPARRQREAEYRRRVDPLDARRDELRLRIHRIRADFAELTTRVATAHGGDLPPWWPPELGCGRCAASRREDSTTP